MKKIIALVLAVIMMVSCAVVFTSCGVDTEKETEKETAGATETQQQTEKTEEPEATLAEYEDIKAAGVMNIGITLYEPMNYYGDNGELVGFDTEYANAVCEKLGITANFIEINWETKEAQLQGGNIDCIWNGLTVSEDRKADMAFTTSYLVNKQCVVIHKDDAEAFSAGVEALQSAIITAEAGSAGETAITTNAVLGLATYSGSESQQSALQAVLTGNADAAVVDITLAKATCGEGDFADLTYLEFDLANEEYAIGFRIGSDMVAKVNAVTEELIEDGTLADIAEKYGMTDLFEAIVK